VPSRDHVTSFAVGQIVGVLIMTYLAYRLVAASSTVLAPDVDGRYANAWTLAAVNGG
jgi:hypothetical protein